MSTDPGPKMGGQSDAGSIDARILAAIGELRVLRQHELEILERIQGLIEERASVGAKEEEPGPISGAREHGEPFPIDPRETPSAAEDGIDSAVSVEDEPLPAPDTNGPVPSWIDDMVDAALAHAFSEGGSEAFREEGDEDDDDREGPEQPPAADPAADIARLAHEESPEGSPDDERGAGSLLLLGCREIWVGIPWDQVERIGLSNETQGSSVHYSLQDLALPGREPLDEPYLITWHQGDDAVSLSTERLGEVLGLKRAAQRGVQAVLIRSGQGSVAPDLISLVEYASRVVAAAPAEPVPATLPPAAAREFEPVATYPTRFSIPLPANSQEDRNRADEMWDHEIEVVPLSESMPTLGPDLRQQCALLAVRYLPARVAIGRHLRANGWTVIEAIDPVDVATRLRNESFQVVFIETAEASSPEILSAIRRVAASDTLVIAVGSRMRGPGIDALRGLGDIPRLFHPFQDIELDRALGVLGRT